ncbi:MAG: hypothetical protein KA408_09950 [Flavobacteriales bacterium]|nr:hypothetical protein [Flavobacteriales bacterium]
MKKETAALGALNIPLTNYDPTIEPVVGPSNSFGPNSRKFYLSSQNIADGSTVQGAQ